jgi:hypothetical protein
VLTVVGSSHEPKKLGPNSSYDNFANTIVKYYSCVLQDLKISLLRFFTDYPIWKFMVFWQTGSYTMLSETYHSLADTMMQAGMAYSNYFAQKKSASSEHPYGYKQAPQIAALGAGICIFTTGALNSRDRTRVEITLFLRRAQPARHWVCVEKTRRKYPNFEKMRRKCVSFFMNKMTSEVAIRGEIFHGHQTTTKRDFYIYFHSFVIFLPISDLFSTPKKC